MIETRIGSALDVETGIIVHGCNCKGVMGSGIALAVKQQYQIVYDVYKRHEQTKGLHLGDISWMEVARNKIIVNAQTQFAYGADKRHVNYDAVYECFKKVNALAHDYNRNKKQILDIVFPKIGAGLGGGEWKVIEALIEVAIDPCFKKILYVLE